MQIFIGVCLHSLHSSEDSKRWAVEMTMFQYTNGIARNDKLRNDCIRESLGMADIKDKMREYWLQWFGQMSMWGQGGPV